MTTRTISKFLAGISMTCMLTSCALDTGTSEDDEGTNIEAAVSEQAVLGSYYTYRNGLGKSTQNAKGVNMTLENLIWRDGRQGSQLRLWPNAALPDSDTRITWEINVHCVKPDGTPYDVRTVYGSLNWLGGQGRATNRAGNACALPDRIVLSRVDWTVDN